MTIAMQQYSHRNLPLPIQARKHEITVGDVLIKKLGVAQLKRAWNSFPSIKYVIRNKGIGGC